MTKKQRNKVTKASTPQLTVSDWSAPNQPPTKIGVYEIKPEYSTGHRMYAQWDGEKWSAESQTIEGAFSLFDYGAVRDNQQVTWRGIIK